MAGIDTLKFFGDLLEEGLDNAASVESMLSETSIDRLPLVIYTFIGSGQSQNGPGLWSGSLIISTIDRTLSGATALQKTIYGIVTSWALPGNGVVDGLGAVESVEDESLFSLSPKSSLIGKDVSQYDGSFGVSLRTIN